MARGYFSYFPTVMYGGQIVTNVLAKVAFDAAVAKNTATFYQHTIEEGERADHIASYYYGDPYYDWVVYLSAQIIDPYFQWPLTTNQMNDYITAKYGSVANAESHVVFYRNNYAQDDTILTPPGYSALASERKWFWTPIIGAEGETIGYERKEIDTAVDTNQITRLLGTFTLTAAGELVTSAAGAEGEVAHGNTSVLTLKNISGEFLANSEVSVGHADAAEVVHTIDPEISAYFSPVTAYAYEDEKNDARKSIQLLQAGYLEQVERDMRELLSA